MNCSNFSTDLTISDTFQMFTKKLIIPNNSDKNVQNESARSSIVVALNRKYAIDEMANCIMQIRMNTILKLNEQFCSFD